jgi:hypothetical protein
MFSEVVEGCLDKIVYVTMSDGKVFHGLFSGLELSDDYEQLIDIEPVGETYGYTLELSDIEKIELAKK